jgi:hypothetical protein
MAGIDPGPFFVLSLLPYLAFLWLAGQVEAFPRLALRGFQLTLLFVAVTIGASLLALQGSGQQLADVTVCTAGPKPSSPWPTCWWRSASPRRPGAEAKAMNKS